MKLNKFQQDIINEYFKDKEQTNLTFVWISRAINFFTLLGLIYSIFYELSVGQTRLLNFCVWFILIAETVCAGISFLILMFIHLVIVGFNAGSQNLQERKIYHNFMLGLLFFQRPTNLGEKFTYFFFHAVKIGIILSLVMLDWKYVSIWFTILFISFFIYKNIIQEINYNYLSELTSETLAELKGE